MGTLIVFIATILVAAIASGVLVQVVSKQQSSSSKAADSGVRQASSGLVIDRLVGKRDNSTSTTNITNLTAWVSLVAGGEPVDLRGVIAIINDGTGVKTLTKADGTNTADGTNYKATERRDPAGTFGDPAVAGTQLVMSSGGMVELDFNLAAVGGANLPIGVRKQATVQLVPEVGNAAILRFDTSESFGADTLIPLK